MNIIFGKVASSAGITDFTRINEYIKENYDQSVTHIDHNDIHVGLTDDNGVVFSSAKSESSEIYLLGNLHHPLPDWPQDISAMSDGDEEAEYLLRRYHSEGNDFLDHVTGQYSVALIDKSKSLLTLASDPSAMRTWYYQADSNWLIFSTHCHSLTRICDSPLEINRELEDFFLQYGFFPNHQTVYKGVQSLKPGTKLTIGGLDNIIESPIRYDNNWMLNLRQQALKADTLEKVSDLLYSSFLQTLKDQLPEEERVAVLLGGFDSALVASLLQRLGKKVETFSFSYDEARFNQPNVELLAQSLGIKHHWVKITADIFADGLNSFPTTFNQPTNWPNYVIQTAHLCRVIREQGIRYCYSGDGCDTVFLGYPGTHRRAVLLNMLPILPKPIVAMLTSLVSFEFLDRKLGHPYRVFLNLVRALGRSRVVRGFISFKILDSISLKQLRDSPPPPQQTDIDSLLEQLSAPHIDLPPLRLAYTGKSLVSPNKNKMIGSADRFGVSIQSPYLHPGLKTMASSLPENLMRPDKKTASTVTGKYILMKMAEDKNALPAEIIYQKKVAGVDGPIDDWYAGPLKHDVLRLTKRLPFSANLSYIEGLTTTTWTEKLFRKKIMVDNVISHAISLLITYSTFNS